MKHSHFFLVLVVVSASLIVGSSAYADHITSQGIYTIESNIVNNVGYTGQEVRVAVIDLGFNITDHEIASNIAENRSFPATYNITGNNNVEHGTSVAQIVVDVAPNVELYLYNYRSAMDFLDLIDYLINRGDIDVVSMSLSQFGAGHYDGTSEFSQKVQEAEENGIIWINSAGNYADRHWSGVFEDDNSDGFHDFGSDQDIDVTAHAGSTVRLQLTWSDPWDASNNDYDLFLLDSSGTTVTSSTITQNGNVRPYEHITFAVPSTDTYAIRISQVSGIASELKLFSRGPHTFNEHRIAAGSVTIPGDSAGSVAVAAVHHDRETLMSYSSQGPTSDGRVKPDISGPSHVMTSTHSSFGGTSAAAPHVAGVAALIKEANPHYTPAQIRAALEDNTKNHHAKSNMDGTGLVNALNSMEFAFVDTFGSDLSQWTEINERDWNVEDPAEKDVPNHDSADNTVAHADACTTFCTIRTAAIDLSDYISASVYFWRYVDNNLDAGEFLRVGASPDNGTSWDTLFTWGDDNDGDDDTWHAETYEIDPSYLTDEFVVRFTASSSASSEEVEIDDVIIYGNDPVFSEPFNDLDRWTESGETDWRVTASPADNAGHPPGADAANSVALANNCDSECILTLDAALDLTGFGSANITMYRYVDSTLDSGEYLRIDASPDNGTSWDTLFTWNDENDSDDGAWHRESVSLPADHMASTAFKIRAVAHMSSSAEDVMIDDVRIYGLPQSAEEPDAPLTDYSVYLADTDDRQVLVFSQNGTYIDDFVSYRSNGLGKVWDVAFGGDGHMYASDYTYKKIRVYNGTTGAPIGTSAGWATTAGYPYGLTWNDGRLYVATSQGVEVFDAAGASRGYFGDASRSPSTAGAPRIYGAQDVAFCPDGRMYVADYSSNQILYYDAGDGTYLGRIHEDPFLDVRSPSGVVCGAASGVGTGETSIYQSGYSRDKVNEIETAKYTRVHVVTSMVDGPYGLDIDGNQVLYVANKNDDNILQIDGTQSSVFAAPRGIDDPRGVALGPVYVKGAPAPGSFAGASDGTFENNDEPTAIISHRGEKLDGPFTLDAVAEFLIFAVDPDGDAIRISLVGDAEPVLAAAPGAISLRDLGNGTAIVTVNGTSVPPGAYVPMIRVADTRDNYDDVLLPIVVP